MTLSLSTETFDELPTIVRAARAGKTSEFAPLFQSMLDTYNETGKLRPLPIPAGDAGWKKVMINGKPAMRHPAVTAANVWGKANGVAFSTRAANAEGNTTGMFVVVINSNKTPRKAKA